MVTCEDIDGWLEWKTISSFEDKALIDILKLPNVRGASYRVNPIKSYVNYKVYGGDPEKIAQILYELLPATVRTVGSMGVTGKCSTGFAYERRFDYVY